MNLGHHAADWKAFCQLTGIEFRPGLDGPELGAT
jgi:hypothetical protein